MTQIPLEAENEFYAAMEREDAEQLERRRLQAPHGPLAGARGPRRCVRPAQCVGLAAQARILDRRVFPQAH